MALDLPSKDGTKLRDNLESVWEQTKNTARPIWDERLDEPEIPFFLAHILGWFWDLNSARGSGGLGPSSITFGDIQAWSKMSGINPTPFEVTVLKMLDAEFLSAVSAKLK